MSQKIEDENGNDVEVYTMEEVTVAKETALKEANESHTKTLAEKETEIARLNKVSAEKTENFKKYNQLTEEERKSYDANTTELIKRNDKTQDEIDELKTILANKEIKEKDFTKTTILKGFHNEDEKTKKSIEENYNYLAGMPETTNEEISVRAFAAARLSGITVDNRNPLYTGFSGEAPRLKPEGTSFTETDKGKEAADIVRNALNIKTS